MREEISPAVIAELAQFLSPKVRDDLRERALDYIVGLSASNEFTTFFQANDFLLGRSLCNIVGGKTSDETRVFPVLVNATATDVACAKYVVKNSGVVHRSIHHCRCCTEHSANTAKLLSNLSLHCPDEIYDLLLEVWTDAISDVIQRLVSVEPCEGTDYLGYVLVNLTSISTVRRILCEKYLQNVLPLVNLMDRPKRCLIAIDILRNLCFETGCHTALLDRNDDFLSTLLRPIADVNDNLDEGEIEKLPLQLQYYEGHRCKDHSFLQKIIEALYQLCGSAIGRETLRRKGVYALLREFDKASSTLSSSSVSLKEKWNSKVASEAVPCGGDSAKNICIHSGVSVGREGKVKRVGDPQQNVISREANNAVVNCIGDESGYFVYIDDKNCSTLHSLIKLLIQN